MKKNWIPRSSRRGDQRILPDGERVGLDAWERNVASLLMTDSIRINARKFISNGSFADVI